MKASPARAVVSRVKAIRAHLLDHGSPEHAAGVQWFFKEEVRSYGWYTGELRAYGRALHKVLSPDPVLMIGVAESLFSGPSLEEKVLAVVMLERSLPAARPAASRRRAAGKSFELAGPEFARLVGWLDAVASWADHDALAMFLLGPMMAAVPSRVKRVHGWARSSDRWHRRAAAVSLIRGIQRGLFKDEAARVTRALAGDQDDMVQKGLGWLLRVWGSVRAPEVVPLLLEIRPKTSRLVLRTACERLPARDRALVLAR